MPCCAGPGLINRALVDNDLHGGQFLVSRGFQPNRVPSRKRERSRGVFPISSLSLVDQLQKLLQDHAAGLLDDPLKSYQALYDSGFQHPILFLNLAQLELGSGDLLRADQLLDQALKLQPALAIAWALRGTVQRRLGQFQESVDFLERALSIDPQNFPACLTLSVVLHDQSHFSEALSVSLKALELDPGSAAAYANHSMIQLALGDECGAELSARQAIEKDPSLPEAYLNLGNALHAQEQWSAAIDAHREALCLRPSFAPALSSLGNALRADDQLDLAEEAFQRAIAADPNYYQAYSNLAITQRGLGKLDQALETCLVAIDKSPMHADIHGNLGIIHHERGDWQSAEDSLRCALALSPDHSESHFSLASLLLQQGRYSEGWKEYEWRFTHNERHPIVREVSDRQRWLGPLAQPRLSEIILLHEQGLGDSFQFVRFAPLLRRYAKRIVMTCPKPLMSLVAASGLVDQVFEIETESSQFAKDSVWLPLMSVPGVLGVPEASFSESVPFLPVDPERRDFWNKRLHQTNIRNGANNFIIALNWQGNPEHEKTTSRGRSIPLEAFRALATLPQVRFVSLQKGYGSEQLESCGFRDHFVDCQEEVDAAWDFEDAAALMDCASLVISSDTSAAHLAGAIGARLWMPLKRISEWRWGTEGSITPWYPTATLFRQTLDGDWSGPVEAMRRALELEIMQGSSESP
jgi:tetratricopeptide (TPR) repeat protein